MKFKTFAGFAALAILLGKGLYRLYQYDNNKCGYNESLPNLGKDAIDAGKDIMNIFYEDDRINNFVEGTAQVGKVVVDSIIESEGR